MASALPTARQEKEEAAPLRARRCLVTGALLPKDELIRFVVDPDHNIVPDLARNLPGRGLWVTAERGALNTAAHKNLFARAAKSSVTAGDDLADRIAMMMHERCLALLGLARSAGIAVLGQPQVEAILKTGKLSLLLIAVDARGEVGRTGTIAVSRRFTRDELGAALGHEQLAYVGLKPHGIGEKLRLDLARLAKIASEAHISLESEREHS